MEGGGTIATAFLDVSTEESYNGSDSIFGNNLVIATGGKSGRFEMGTWKSYGGEGGTPNGINGNDGHYSDYKEPVILSDIIGTNGINYGKYGGVNGIAVVQTRAPDPGTRILIQGGSGGILTKTITLPSGSFTIKIGKQGQDVIEALSESEISYTQVSGSRNGCILVEYGEGISL